MSRVRTSSYSAWELLADGRINVGLTDTVFNLYMTDEECFV